MSETLLIEPNINDNGEHVNTKPIPVSIDSLCDDENIDKGKKTKVRFKKNKVKYDKKTMAEVYANMMNGNGNINYAKIFAYIDGNYLSTSQYQKYKKYIVFTAKKKV